MSDNYNFDSKGNPIRGLIISAEDAKRHRKLYPNANITKPKGYVANYQVRRGFEGHRLVAPQPVKDANPSKVQFIDSDLANKEKQQLKQKQNQQFQTKSKQTLLTQQKKGEVPKTKGNWQKVIRDQARLNRQEKAAGRLGTKMRNLMMSIRRAGGPFNK